ncbi:hypothetical protein LAB1_35390 [Roseibium sp. LAB1]
MPPAREFFNKPGRDCDCPIAPATVIRRLTGVDFVRRHRDEHTTSAQMGLPPVSDALRAIMHQRKHQAVMAVSGEPVILETSKHNFRAAQIVETEAFRYVIYQFHDCSCSAV